MRIPTRFVSLVCSSLVARSATSGPSPAPGEAIACWRQATKRYGGHTGTVRGESTMTHPAANGGAAHTRGDRWELAAGLGAYKMAHTWDDPREIYFVHLSNRNYTAHLERKAEAAGWLLKQFIPRPDAPLPELGCPVSVAYQRELTPLYCVAGEWLADAVDQSLIEFTATREVTTSGRKYVELDYRPTGKHKTRGFVTVAVGTLRFDPQAKWCIVERNDRMKWSDGPGQAKQTYEFTAATDGYPLIRRGTYEEAMDPPGRYTRRVQSTYDIRATSPADESEFLLSAYGLPEPRGAGGRRTPTSLYLLLSAAAFAAVAVPFGWLARRRGQRQTSPAVPARVVP